MIKAVCVFCASSNHVDQIHTDVAATLGELIAKRIGTLVYGGGNIGSMGVIARAVHTHGGKVVGVIPTSMVEHEVAYKQADELIVTNTMRQRKQIMEDRADAFITLPGGFGTLEELTECLTHRQLKYHEKPIVLINTQGFYNPLLAFFEHLYVHRFAKEKMRTIYHVVDSPGAAIDLLVGC